MTIRTAEDRWDEIPENERREYLQNAKDKLHPDNKTIYQLLLGVILLITAGSVLAFAPVSTGYGVAGTEIPNETATITAYDSLSPENQHGFKQSRAYSQQEPQLSPEPTLTSAVAATDYIRYDGDYYAVEQTETRPFEQLAGVFVLGFVGVILTASNIFWVFSRVQFSIQRIAEKYSLSLTRTTLSFFVVMFLVTTSLYLGASVWFTGELGLETHSIEQTSAPENSVVTEYSTLSVEDKWAVYYAITDTAGDQMYLASTATQDTEYIRYEGETYRINTENNKYLTLPYLALILVMSLSSTYVFYCSSIQPRLVLKHESEYLR